MWAPRAHVSALCSGSSMWACCSQTQTMLLVRTTKYPMHSFFVQRQTPHRYFCCRKVGSWVFPVQLGKRMQCLNPTPLASACSQGCLGRSLQTTSPHSDGHWLQSQFPGAGQQVHGQPEKARGPCREICARGRHVQPDHEPCTLPAEERAAGVGLVHRGVLCNEPHRGESYH